MPSRMLKVFHGDDVRHIRLEMPEDDKQCFEAVQTAVVKAFGIESCGAATMSLALMCEDQDVLCELTTTTLCKLLNESDGSCLRLYICETGCTENSPEGNAPASPTERTVCSEQLSDSEEFEIVDDVSLQGNASAEVHETTSSQDSFIRIASLPMPDMQKKPDHVGEGLLQGLHHMGHHVGQGFDKFKSKGQQEHQEQGVIGELKGAGEGLLGVGLGVWKGMFDLHASTVDGLRRTPDTIADQVNRERLHNKHGVQGEGRGELLETNLDNEEPQHIAHGFLRGAEGLGRGFSGGLKALVARPRDACREKGIKGLPEGLGQGVLGLGTNVGAGAFDYAVNMSLGWKNTPEAIVRALKRENSGRMPATPDTALDALASQDNVQHVIAEFYAAGWKSVATSEYT